MMTFSSVLVFFCVNLKKCSKHLLSFLLLMSIFQAKGQSKITGQVIDDKSKEPIAGATIYIDQTQFVTRSDEKGFFHFENIPTGTQLVITHVSYTKETVSSRDHILMVIPLEQNNKVLDNVILKSKTQDTWNKWGTFFETYFLGSSKNVVLRNPEDVFFHYDAQKKALKVRAKNTLLIENRPLGYLIHVDLDSFIYSFSTGGLFILFPTSTRRCQIRITRINKPLPPTG